MVWRRSGQVRIGDGVERVDQVRVDDGVERADQLGEGVERGRSSKGRG